LIGVLIGWFAIGWGLWPVEWSNTDPIDLRQEEREDYLVMVASEYALNYDASVALGRLQSWPSLADADREIRDLAEYYDAQGETNRSSVLRMLAQGLPLPSAAPQAEQPAAEPSPSTTSSLVKWAKIVLVAAAVLGLVILAVYLVRQRMRPVPRDRLRERIRESRPVAVPQPVADEPDHGQDYAPDYEADAGSVYEPAPSTSRETIAARVFRRAGAQTVIPSWTFEARYEGQGMDFDQTFTLDDADGEYFGECGVGAATAVGVDFDRVNSLEIWLFDKSDIRTVAKVLMSEKSYNDRGLREELSTRGEPVLAVPGTRFSLEGNTISADVEVTEVSYLTGAAAHNAFGRVALRLAVGQRNL
jgi:hypothetical protein